jgi:hypothetical protein
LEKHEAKSSRISIIIVVGRFSRFYRNLAPRIGRRHQRGARAYALKSTKIKLNWNSHILNLEIRQKPCQTYLVKNFCNNFEEVQSVDTLTYYISLSASDTSNIHSAFSSWKITPKDPTTGGR